MRQLPRFENPIFSQVISHRWNFSKTCFAIVVLGGLLLVICQLLFRAKLGQYADLILLSEALLILIISPYIACSALTHHFAPSLSTNVLQLSRMRLRWVWLNIIFGSQVHLFCFLALTSIVFTILLPSTSNITHREVIQAHLIFAIYTILGALVGGFWWSVLRHQIFATLVTYLGWALLIGGVFLLSSLDRYLENLEPIIPPFLHLNPLMAVCHLLEMDVFRTPHLYELTPVPSYRVVYPPWHTVCTWQILIGSCCVALARWNRV